MAFRNRFEPLKARLLGHAPQCPWSTVARNLHPAVWGAKPPAQDIRVIETAGSIHLLRFGNRHDFWFPVAMEPNGELWSEYLVTVWDHRSNPHYYLRKGVTVAKGDVVLDCGACEGFFARQALDAGAAKVLCIEPNPEMVECLNKTFHPEIAEGRLEVRPVGLGAFICEAFFNTSPGDAFSGQFDGRGTNKVPITTIDALFADESPPTLLKMDLEGSEYEALRGGQEILARHHPKLAITTYHNAWDYSVIHSLLKGLGYPHTTTTSATMRGTDTPRPMVLNAWA